MTVSMDEIQEAFSLTNNKINQETLENLAHISRIFNLDAERLHNKWEAFVLSASGNSNSSSCDVTAEGLEKFKSYLKSTSILSSSTGGASTGILGPKKKFEAKVQNTLNKDSFQQFLKGGSFENLSQSTATPSQKPKLSQSTPSATSESPQISKVEQQHQKQQDIMFIDSISPSSQSTHQKSTGKAEIVFNPQLQVSKYACSSLKRCEIAAYPQCLLHGYKYMYDKPADRSRVIDERINFMETILAHAYNLQDGIGHPGQASQFPVKTVGKIMSDSSNKINEKCVLFETSCVNGAANVRLILDGIPNFSIFPGQIVGLQGVNNTGREFFHVREIMEPPVPENETSPLNQLYEYNYGKQFLNGLPLRVFLAAGPFTVDSDLTFGPLKRLLSAVSAESCDTLILIGPFIDENHPLLMSPQMAMSAEEIFSAFVLLPLLSILETCPALQIVLLPSCRDIIHPWCAFPQPPIQIQSYLSPADKQKFKTTLHRLVSLSNPAVFAINEIIFAIESDDVLMEMSKEEISRFSNSSIKLDRLGRLVRHLITQRSFYPIIPTGVSTAENIPVDYSRLDTAQLIMSPDIFITPSKLSLFAKHVEKSLCINPGYLSKGSNSGTFAKIDIFPLAKENFKSMHGEEAEAEESPEIHSLGCSLEMDQNLVAFSEDQLGFVSGSIFHLFDSATQKLVYFKTPNNANISAISTHSSSGQIALATHNGSNVSILLIEKSWILSSATMNESEIEIVPTATIQVELFKKITALSFDMLLPRLACGGISNDYVHVTIWDLKTLEPITSHRSMFEDDIFKIQFHPSLRDVLFTCGNGQVKFWKIVNSLTKCTLEAQIGSFGEVEPCGISSFAYTSNDTCVSGTDHGYMLFWKSGSARNEIYMKSKISCHSAAIEFLRLEDGELITGGNDGYIRFWDVKTLENANYSKGYSEIEPLDELLIGKNVKILHLAQINNDGLNFVLDSSGAIWKVDTRKRKCEKLRAFPGVPFTSLSSHSDLSIFTLGSVNGTVKVFDITSNHVLASFQTDSAVKCSKIITDGPDTFLMVGYENGFIKVYRNDQYGKLALFQVERIFDFAISNIYHDVVFEIFAITSSEQTFFLRMESSKRLKPLGYWKHAGNLNILKMLKHTETQVVLIGHLNSNLHRIEISLLRTVPESYELTEVKTTKLNFPRYVDSISSACFLQNDFFLLGSTVDGGVILLTLINIHDISKLICFNIENGKMKNIIYKNGSVAYLDQNGDLYHSLLELDPVKPSKSVLKSTTITKYSNYMHGSGIVYDFGPEGSSLIIGGSDGSLTILGTLKKENLNKFSIPTSIELWDIYVENNTLSQLSFEGNLRKLAGERLNKEFTQLRNSLLAKVDEMSDKFEAAYSDKAIEMDVDAGLEEHFASYVEQEKEKLSNVFSKDIAEEDRILANIERLYVDPYFETSMTIKGLLSRKQVSTFEILKSEIISTPNSSNSPAHAIEDLLKEVVSISENQVKTVQNLFDKQELKKMSRIQRDGILSFINSYKPLHDWENDQVLDMINQIFQCLQGYIWKDFNYGIDRGIVDLERKQFLIQQSLSTQSLLKLKYNGQVKELYERKKRDYQDIAKLCCDASALYEKIGLKSPFSKLLDNTDIKRFELTKTEQINVVSLEESKRRNAFELNRTLNKIEKIALSFDRSLLKLINEGYKYTTDILLCQIHQLDLSKEVQLLEKYQRSVAYTKSQLAILKEQMTVVSQNFKATKSHISELNLQLKTAHKNWLQSLEKYGDVVRDILGESSFQTYQCFRSQSPLIPDATKPIEKAVLERIFKEKHEIAKIVADFKRELTEQELKFQNLLETKQISEVKCTELDNILHEIYKGCHEEIMKLERIVILKPSQISGTMNFNVRLRYQNEAVIFDQHHIFSLNNLCNRAETILADIKQLVTNSKRMLIETKSTVKEKENILEKNTQEFIDMQIVKFGKKVDLRELEMISVNPKVEERKKEIMVEENEKIKEEDDLERMLKQSQNSHKEIMDENTKLLNDKIDLADKYQRLSSEIDSIKKRYEKSQSKTYVELEELKITANQYSSMIDETRQEILQLRSKAPFSYPLKNLKEETLSVRAFPKLRHARPNQPNNQGKFESSAKNFQSIVQSPLSDEIVEANSRDKSIDSPK